MNYKHKKMLIWDLKELESFSPQMLVVEPFNMWPTGNCGHIYSASHAQARRHISGWAMRNTNNHNINILKKSCLGVLVCINRCRRSDSSVVAVRPAICDKARRKQIGRKCPNGCGGVLVMQQCKGHSGYPVTHFWRHHEDKVFFLGKGHHDHPKPELKLCAEKRKAYIRLPTRRSTGPISCSTRPPLSNNMERRRRQSKTIQPGLGMHSTSKLPSYHQQTNLSCYSAPSSYSYPMQILQDQPITAPDCDFYIPPISQELAFPSNQPLSSFYQSSAAAEIPETPNFYYPFGLNSAASNSYAADPMPTPSIGLPSRQEVNTQGYEDASTILDLSMPTVPVPLDFSWQSDAPEFSRTTSSYYDTNQYQTSTISTTNEIVERSILQTSKVSTITEKTYETRIHEKKGESFKLHALWDSIYPAEEQNHTSAASQYNPFDASTSAVAISADNPLKEVVNFDELDMSDISNILSIPPESTKPAKPDINGKASSSQLAALRPLSPDGSEEFLTKSSVSERRTNQLPNLSSFLEDLDYL